MRDSKFEVGESWDPLRYSPLYRVDSLNWVEQLIEKQGVDGAMEWLGSWHPREELARVVRRDIKTLSKHEYLNADGGFGVFGINGAKIGSYVLNRWGEHSTITKDMWFARTMARLTGEPLIVNGQVIKTPWTLRRDHLRLRMLTDQAWTEVGRTLGMTPARVQQAMWDMEQLLYNNLGSSRKATFVSDGLARGEQTFTQRSGRKVKGALPLDSEPRSSGNSLRPCRILVDE